jgi:hypothetical protein
MSSSLVARRHDWVDPAVVFATILCDDEHAFWLDAGPAATAGFSWMGVGAPDATPRDLPLVADAQQPAVVPGPLQGGWVGWWGSMRRPRPSARPRASTTPTDRRSCGCGSSGSSSSTTPPVSVDRRARRPRRGPRRRGGGRTVVGFACGVTPPRCHTPGGPHRIRPPDAGGVSGAHRAVPRRDPGRRRLPALPDDAVHGRGIHTLRSRLHLSRAARRAARTPRWDHPQRRHRVAQRESRALPRGHRRRGAHAPDQRHPARPRRRR